MNRYNQPYSDQSDPLFQKGEMIQGNQLNLVHHSINNERLPASAGLPSAAGLYRSNSAGGGTLNGIAEDMKFLTGLMLNKKKKSISVPTLMKTSIKTKEPTQKRTLMTYKEPKFNTINPIALYKLNPKKKKKKKLNGSSHQEFTKKSKSLPNIVDGKPGHPLVHGNWNLSDPTLRKQPSTIQLDDPFQQQFHRLSIDSVIITLSLNFRPRR
ncbi:hypothetical protein BC833DRAFT_1395 [Globomyces pollinis-pini]|nr:hypothetical protein BC833DRAFT_1395 [Globomyces pollinis-pini]